LRDPAQAGMAEVEEEPTGLIENDVLTFEPLFPVGAP
jgi:hypothetical protein